MSSRAHGEYRITHVFALLLFALVGDVTAARIQPGSSVSKTHASGQRRVKTHPHLAAASLATDSHNLAEQKRVKDDASVHNVPGALKVSDALLEQVAGRIVAGALKNTDAVLEHTEEAAGIVSRIHAKAVSLLSAVPPMGRAAPNFNFNSGKKNSTDWVLLAVGTSSFLVVAFFFTFCIMQCCMPSGKKGKGKERQKRTDSALTSSSTCTSRAGETPSQRQQHTHHGRLVYEWDQTDKQAGVYLKVPEGLTKHDLDIKISARRVQVGRMGKPPFLREKTYDTIDEEATGWRLRSNGELQILLVKEREGHWPRVLLERERSSATPSSGKQEDDN